MKNRFALLTCACVLALGCQLASAADGPDPPSRTVAKSKPGSAHAKASSFAPEGHSKNHVYGAPIGAPILHSRKPARKGTSPGSANNAPK
jgi:hypothetical protein